MSLHHPVVYVVLRICKYECVCWCAYVRVFLVTCVYAWVGSQFLSTGVNMRVGVCT